MRLISATEQRTIEMAASKLGMDVSTMMLNAGEAVYHEIIGRYNLKEQLVVVLCGHGGNGGDGFVVGRCLADYGAKPLIVLCDGTPKGEAAHKYYTEVVGRGVPVRDVETDLDDILRVVPTAALVVDAVFGIGFSGALPDRIAVLFDVINASGVSVVAVDVPSGIDADNGTAAVHSLRAAVTLTVIGSKPAELFKRTSPYFGECSCIDIALPQEAYNAVRYGTRHLSPELAATLLPERDECAHKYDFGNVVCFAGNDRYRGAAVLCASGALYGGAGLVQVSAEEKVLAAVAAHHAEVILIDRDTDLNGLARAYEKATAYVVGCGLAEDEETERMVRDLLQRDNAPLVIDAGGLKFVPKYINIIRSRENPVVITPHIGEFAQMISSTPDIVMRNRIRLVREFAQQGGLITVLKSENTLVALPDGTVYINTAGNSGLARGGSGDLLSGLIGAQVAVNKAAGEAALLGVYLHSLAGDLAAKFAPKQALTPSFVADFIPSAFKELLGNS